LATIPSGKIDQAALRAAGRRLLEAQRRIFERPLSSPSEQRLADVERRMAAMEQTVRDLRREAEHGRLDPRITINSDRRGGQPPLLTPSNHKGQEIETELQKPLKLKLGPPPEEPKMTDVVGPPIEPSERGGTPEPPMPKEEIRPQEHPPLHDIMRQWWPMLPLLVLFFEQGP
jgi:hypothetical protein